MAMIDPFELPELKRAVKISAKHLSDQIDKDVYEIVLKEMKKKKSKKKKC